MLKSNVNLSIKRSQGKLFAVFDISSLFYPVLLKRLYCLDWTGLDWTGLDWTGLDWTGLDWTGLDWTGLDWTGLDWTGLDWTGLD